MEKHSTVDDVTYNMSLKLNTVLNDNSIKLLIPKEVIDKNLIEYDDFALNNGIYEHKLKLDSTELEKQFIDRISIDVLYFYTDENKIETKVLQSNIPFELN